MIAKMIAVIAETSRSRMVSTKYRLVLKSFCWHAPCSHGVMFQNQADMALVIGCAYWDIGIVTALSSNGAMLTLFDFTMNTLMASRI